MRRVSVVLLLTAALIFVPPAVAHATDYYVAADGNDARNTGLQGSPLLSVQNAVDRAFASGGGTVYVGPGTFTGNVILRNNVSLCGAGADRTTLKGTANGPVIALGDLRSGESISGFTITGGSAERGGGIYLFFSSPTITDNVITGNTARKIASWESGVGGGIYCDAGNPTISNNVISNNTAQVSGGGIYLSDSWATVTGNTITGNVTNASGSDRSSGGGIYGTGGAPVISRNVITGNSATGTDPRGGGIGLWMCPASVAANTITGNTAVSVSYYNGQGGGIYLFGSSATISGNEIAENAAVGEYGEGGGIYFYSGMSTYAPAITENTVRDNLARSNSGWGGARGGGMVLSDGAAVVSGNRITGNTADGDFAEGGGIYASAFWNPSAPVIVNDVIAGNIVYGSSGAGGSAVSCQSSSPRITNVTITGNTHSGGLVARALEADSFWFASTPVITNCIVWSNTGGSFMNCSATYSCFPAGGPTDGNINGDPLLTADYLLTSGSPCIDTASAAAAPARDILGTPRPQGAGPDMGAHEFAVLPPVPPFAVDDLYTVAEDGVLAVSGRGVLANDAVGYDLVPLSASLVIPPTLGSATVAEDGSFTYTPNPGVSGTDTFLYRATDRIGGVDGAWVTITIAEVDDAPVLGVIGDKSIDERVSLVFTASATDEDTAASGLTYSLGAGAPAGATIHAETGAFAWTPTEAQGPGEYSIQVVVFDGNSLDTETILVTVADVPTAPVLASIGAQGVAEGSTLSFTAAATDEDLPADTLAFSLGAGAPAGATLDPVTGAFSWTPGEADGPGSYDVTITVSDGVRTDSETITVTVAEVATVPVLTAIGSKSVDELTALTFTAAAIDADLPTETLTFSLGADAPAGAAIDSATGVFSWTPTEAQGPGVHDITVTVNDGVLKASETITVTVAEVASAPALAAIGNKSVDELSVLSFTAAATDADIPAGTLTFSLWADAPAGAAIDSATGVFSWTPTEAQGPGSYPITVSVSDGVRTDSETFTVTVAEVADPRPLASGGTTARTNIATAAGATAGTSAGAAPASSGDGAVGVTAPAESDGRGDDAGEMGSETFAIAPESDPVGDESPGFPWWAIWLLLALAGLGLFGWLLRRGRKTAEAA